MNEPRCALSDLLVSQCDHCRPKAPVVEREVPPGAFVAVYPGRCTECYENIDAGVDLITRAADDGGWVHVECAS